MGNSGAMIAIATRILVLVAQLNICSHFYSFGSGVSANNIPKYSPKMTIEVAQADFALKLLKICTEGNNESAIISPYSLAVALSMTYAGAEGNTKHQLANLLANNASEDEIHEYFTETLAEFADKSKNYTLESANRLYVKQGFAIKDAFKELMKTKYSGQFLQANFSLPEPVAEEINSWVAEQTHDKIKDLIGVEMITEDLRMILINAIYFKGKWQAQFDKELTKKKPFYLSDADDAKQVDMMSKKGHFNYGENDDAKVLGVPYERNEAFMYIILPKQRFGLAELEKKLDGQKLLEMIDESYDQEVYVEIPKFTLDSKFEMVETLRKLGLTDALSTRANFNGISDEPLYISDVIHKAFVEVNEEGTEAAAASAIGINLRSAPMSRRPETFIADQPFLLAIAVSGRRSPIFVGRFVAS